MTALSVAGALSAVMEDVQKISKDQAVTSGPARFNFRGVDDVMQAVGPALRKHGVIFAPSRVVSVEHERYETAKGSPMDGVTVIVEYTITGPAGDVMTAASAGQAADSGDKAVPKAMSVAYRTVLLQALCIPTGDPDPDSQVHERAPRPPEAPVDVVRKVAGLAGIDAAALDADIAARHGGLTLADLSADELRAEYKHYLDMTKAGT
jgi:ERF superfamily protein